MGPDVAQMSMMRSFRRDPAVTEKRLAPGTWKRIARFAAPYRRELAVFVGLVVLAALVGVLNPLIFKQIIDEGIGTGPGDGRPGLVVALALVCLLYTSPSPRDKRQSRMPSSA